MVSTMMDSLLPLLLHDARPPQQTEPMRSATNRLSSARGGGRGWRRRRLLMLPWKLKETM